MQKTLAAKRPARVSNIARTAHALGDDTRVAIIELLAANGELCVCDVVEALDLAQPLLSHHLRVLREAGLVHDRREGRWMYYSLIRDAFIAYTLAVAALAGDSTECRSNEGGPKNSQCR
jgi:ArsR family transcriptional regulator